MRKDVSSWSVGREHTTTVDDEGNESTRTWTTLRLCGGGGDATMTCAPAETRKLITALYASLDKEDPPSDG